MDESVRTLDYSETTLKRELPVILAALRKPVENNYCCRDFKNRICFIPRSICTAAEVSSQYAPSLVGERESCEGLCEQKLPPAHEGDTSTFGFYSKSRLSDERSKPAEPAYPTKASRATAARETGAEELHKHNTGTTDTFSSALPSEGSEQTTAESGLGSSDGATPCLFDTAGRHSENPHIPAVNRLETNDQGEYSRHGSTHSGLDDFIPCLFYRWPLSDTLIVHFHGFDEDLKRTTSYLERLHQQLEINVLAMEYPGYGICSALPRDTNGTKDEILCESGHRKSFLQKSVSLHQSRDFASKTLQPKVLPQPVPPSSVVGSSQLVSGQLADIRQESATASHDRRNGHCKKKVSHSVQRGFPSIGTDSATEGASAYTTLLSSADYPRIAASCSRLMIFVLKRLEVAPQCIFLSAVKLAAGLVLEPLFIFPCSPPGKSDPACVKQSEKSVSPRGPVLDFDGGHNQQVLEQCAPWQRTQSIQTQVLDSTNQPAVTENSKIFDERPLDITVARRIRGDTRICENTKQNIDLHRLTKHAAALPVLEELCTMSSLYTTAEFLPECKQERAHYATVTQAERSPTEDELALIRMEQNTTTSQFAAGTPIARSEQMFPFTKSLHTRSPINGRSSDLRQAELSAPSRLGGRDSSATNHGLAHGEDATHRPSEIRSVAGGNLLTSCDQSMLTNTAVIPASAFAHSDCQTQDAYNASNTPVPSATRLCLESLAVGLNSASNGSNYIQSLKNGSTSVDAHFTDNTSGPSASVNTLTASASVHSGQNSNAQVDKAAEDVCATSTAEKEDKYIFSSDPPHDPFENSGRASASKSLSLETPSKSFLSQISGFLLPSFTLVPQREPEEGGRTAAIAQAALQASRRKRLERLRRTAAALEDAFGVKQAVQRVRSISCPILFLAHRAAVSSRSLRARGGLCRSPDTSSERDILTNRSSTSLSSSESDTSAFVSNSDVTDISNIAMVEGESVSAKHRVTQNHENESASADDSSVCASTREEYTTAPCFTGLGASKSRERDTPQTKSLGNEGNGHREEEGKSGSEKVVGAKGVLAEGRSDMGQQLCNWTQYEKNSEKTQCDYKVSDKHSNTFLQNEIFGTHSAVAKHDRTGYPKCADKYKAGSGGARLAEDLLVDRSIGVLMAHTGNSSHNEVITTFQLDKEFFSRIKAFIQKCRQTERNRQQLLILAALRVPISLTFENLADNRCRIENALDEKPQRRRREVAKKARSSTKLRDLVKSGSRLGHTGKDMALCVPLKLFRIPPPYKNRDEELIRAYARDRVDEDEDRENLISEQSWLHK